MRIPSDAVAATAALGSLVPLGLQNRPGSSEGAERRKAPSDFRFLSYSPFLSSMEY